MAFLVVYVLFLHESLNVFYVSDCHLSQSLQPPTAEASNFQRQKTMENPIDLMVQISSIDSRGQKKHAENNVGVRQRKDRKKFWKLPGIVLFQTFCQWTSATLYLHACVSSKLRCRCYIFFLYIRFLTLGKTLIRIMPEFGILLHIYIDLEALFLSTFLCTNWSLTTLYWPRIASQTTFASRQFSPPSPWAFRCCKVSPTLPSGKVQNSPRVQGKRRM